MKEKLYRCADRFYDYLVDIRGYSEHTLRSYETSVTQMLRVVEIDRETDGTYIADITPFRLQIATLSKKSIALKLSAVRSFIRFLQERCEIAVTLRGDSAIKTPQTLPKPVEASHIDEVLETASLEERVLVMMLYGLGMRIGELAGFRLDQLEGEWARIHGKGDKTRHVPLPAALRRTLDLYLEEAKPKRYLFEKRGVPLNDAQLRYKLTKLFKRHGIEATPHRLRHAFATQLLEHGARIADVSELLGHTSMATTQIYTKLSASKKMREYRKAHPLIRNEQE